MITTSIRTASVAVATVATVAVCGASAATASAAPIKGEWTGNHSTSFQVGSKVTEFRTKCYPLVVEMRVSGGRFRFNRKMSLQGGKARRLKISGRFINDGQATGTVRYGRCSIRFTARALNVPEPEPAPEPAPAPEPEG